MKKGNYRVSNEAFTLAEALISMLTIGVVAALTIPNLIAFFTDRELASSKKKAMSILLNGYKKMMAEQGVELKELPIFKCGEDFNCLSELHRQIFHIANDRTKSHTNLSEKYKQSRYEEETGFSWDEIPYIFTTTDNLTYGFMIDENHEGINIVTDLNNKRSPNKVGKDLLKFRIDKNMTIKDVSKELDDIQACEYPWGLNSGGECACMNGYMSGGECYASGYPSGSGYMSGSGYNSGYVSGSDNSSGNSSGSNNSNSEYPSSSGYPSGSGEIDEIPDFFEFEGNEGLSEWGYVSGQSGASSGIDDLFNSMASDGMAVRHKKDSEGNCLLMTYYSSYYGCSTGESWIGRMKQVGNYCYTIVKEGQKQQQCYEGCWGPNNCYKTCYDIDPYDSYCR